MSQEMTSEEIAQIERRLGELLGGAHTDVADFSSRHLIRCLGEIKRLRAELARRTGAPAAPAARPSGIFIVDTNSMLNAQGM